MPADAVPLSGPTVCYATIGAGYFLKHGYDHAVGAVVVVSAINDPDRWRKRGEEVPTLPEGTYDRLAVRSAKRLTEQAIAE